MRIFLAVLGVAVLGIVVSFFRTFLIDAWENDDTNGHWRE